LPLVISGFLDTQMLSERRKGGGEKSVDKGRRILVLIVLIETLKGELAEGPCTF